MSDSNVLLQVNHLKKYFGNRNQYQKAVDDVSFSVGRTETVGLVGESGCGKSTLGRSVLRLIPITDGEIIFNGKHIEQMKNEELRQMRTKMQLIFQDPFASLNPRMTIYQSVKAPLDAFSAGTEAEKREKIEALLQYVGLSPNSMYKYPHEMSGGQRQRVVIARALIIKPEFIVGDEPVSALDVSVRAQVLNLMKSIQQDYKLSYLFISHDMSVVRYMCDVILVMYLGKIVEISPAEELFTHPGHPYTQALISAIPVPDVTHRRRKNVHLQGDVPNPLNIPAGCRFHTRCPYAIEQCRKEEPALQMVGQGHKVACWRNFL